MFLDNILLCFIFLKQVEYPLIRYFLISTKFTDKLIIFCQLLMIQSSLLLFLLYLKRDSVFISLNILVSCFMVAISLHFQLNILFVNSRVQIAKLYCFHLIPITLQNLILVFTKHLLSLQFLNF